MKLPRFWPWLLLLVPVALGLARVRFDVEVLNLLPDKLPVVQGLKLYQQNFSNARELIVTAHSPDPEKTEMAARSLAGALRARPELVRQVAWQPIWTESPNQAAELVAYLWLNQPPELFAQLTNRLTGADLTNTLLEAREQLATSMSPNEIALRGYDPFNLLQLPEIAGAPGPAFGSGEELFASADRTFRVLFVESTPDLTNYRQCVAWLNSIKALVERTRLAGGIALETEIRYTGRPAFVAEIAGGMERDMFGSVGGTLVIIVGLFYWAHRRWRPLLWLLVLLITILGGTMALGGLLFGTLNVVSLGFAAILLGLAVDYGLVLYQEAQFAPILSVAQLRREIAPSIFWSAVTTAGAFVILNLSGLPGLAQLGSLVAIGVALAALIMLFAFLPPLMRDRNALPPATSSSGSKQPRTAPMLSNRSLDVPPRLLWGITVFVAVLATGLFWKDRPRFDQSADALKPRNSAAYAALEEIKTRLGRTQEPMWILVPGQTEREVSLRLARVQAFLERAVTNGWISSYTLPTPLWPQAENQLENRDVSARLIALKETLRAAALAQGFTSNSFVITENLLNVWQRALSVTNVFWPTNQASHWVLGKVVARPANAFLALGLIYPATNSAGLNPSQLATLNSQLFNEGVLLSGWQLLGQDIFTLVKRDLPRVLLPMIVLLLFSLWLAFRRWTEVLLSLATLLFGALCLWSIMDLAGWSWNLLNMMALPLLLGAGVDYSIHMQLALRRHGGDVRAVQRTVGRALFLCAGTTVAGFGSLSWSNNAGMASLGKVCSIGIACAYLTAVFLLPAWWQTLVGPKKSRSGAIGT